MEQAVDMLMAIAPLGLRDPIDALLGSLSLESQPDYQVEAHVVGRTSASPSIAVTNKHPYRNDMWIVATDPSNIRPLTELIPTDKPYFLCLVDDHLSGKLNAKSLEKALMQCVDLKPDGVRLDLHASNESLIRSHESSIETIQLKLEHKDLFQSNNEWVMGQWDVHWLMETVIYGCLVDERIIAFCTAGQKRFGGKEILLVYTDESHRGRGYGKAALLATTQHVLDEGDNLLYSVEEDNAASIALAKSVGYVHHSTSHFFDAQRIRGSTP